MRVKVVLTGVGYAQTANIPCDGTDTVEQLKQKIKKRITGVADKIDLIFDGGKVFDEDTLNDLGIKDGDTLTEDNGNSGLPPQNNIDLTVGEISISSAPTSAAAGSTTTTTTSASPPSASPDSQHAGLPPPSSPTPTPSLSTPTAGEVVSPAVAPRPLDEILVIVFDISSSMGATFVQATPEYPTSALSRVSAAKICFGAFIDKTLAYEYQHALGLICFGQNLHYTLPVTRDLQVFESVFGDVIKMEGATNLYPAVDMAVKKIHEYSKSLPSEIIGASMKKRILCFTDGGDNSGWSSYKVFKDARLADIIVDAIVVGGDDSEHVNLRSLAHATGGLSVRIPEHEASLSSAFEREEILSLAARVARPSANADIKPEAFSEYGKLLLYPYVGVDLKEVSAAQVQKPVVASKALTVDALDKLASAAPTSTTSSSGGSGGGGGGGGAHKRIIKEYGELQSNKPGGSEAYIVENDIFKWKVFLRGPLNTPYEGGLWVVDVEFPKDYPFKPPKVVFNTQLYHCNVSNGRVCLDILKDQWSPALTISRVMLSLQSLMSDPNPDDALDAWKASLCRTDRKEYDKQAREHTQKYAYLTADEGRILHNLSL